MEGTSSIMNIIRIIRLHSIITMAVDSFKFVQEASEDLETVQRMVDNNLDRRGVTIPTEVSTVLIELIPLEVI